MTGWKKKQQKNPKYKYNHPQTSQQKTGLEIELLGRTVDQLSSPDDFMGDLKRLGPMRKEH